MGRLVLRSVAGAGSLSSFSTSFPLTENPISEGGIYTVGGTDGVNWQDVRTDGVLGIAYGVGPSAGFDDCLAILAGRFSTTKHYSRITVRRVAGYAPPSTHEVECLVGFSISSGVAKGYEMDFGFGLTVQPVRWNGDLGDFDVSVFTTVSGAAFSVADGDIAETQFDSSSGSPIMTLYKNGVESWKITDTSAGKILSGSPGMGFFARTGTGLDVTKYCLSAWAAGNLS